MRFRTKVHAHRWLSTTDDLLSVVLVVDGTGLTGADTPPAAAEVIMVDCSGSMSLPPSKIAAARRATAAAVDALRDGVRFALVAGTDTASLLYPLAPRMATADERSRAEARQAAAAMVASGGTAMGSWLLLARDLLAAHPGAIRHAILLTDGQNVGETPEQLEAALRACAGEFTCDARGIGADWKPAELRRITAALRGRADAVRAEADLAEDFTGMVAEAMRKVVPEVRIRVQTRPGTEIRFLRQVFPVAADLTAEAVAVGEGLTEFSTGSWSADLRHFNLGLTVGPAGAPHGQDVPVGSVRLLAVPPGTTAAEEVGEPEPLLVHWTEDEARFSQVDPYVGHYRGQERLRRLVIEGCEALDAGDRAAAADLLGEAVRLATASGNTEQLDRIGQLAEIEDAAAGRIRLTDELSKVDINWLDGGSGISVVPGQQLPVPASEPLPDRRCPVCELVWPGAHRFCEECKGALD
ncbi:VWA domain-containing protein [Crossiella sp. CA-258035]|uniref:vWA domain-containing protein n=1 Tax=Crossiella sp. CA-258035 TaxID=2981138 RepID=UPI0024BD4675|nr:vWA domain-containing protein [Crossiella sp. CA-258035]WHT18511.1 VWA domain-containing protein [Crossiella sp. CA-258035]